MMGRMFKNPLFCCEMMTLGPICCRQTGVSDVTYGEADECNKVTTSMDGGRCKKAAKDGTLKKRGAKGGGYPAANESSWYDARF